MATVPAWGSTANGAPYQEGPPTQTRGPPPICFKCGNQGHFVVNCPLGAQGNAPHPDAASHASYSNQPNGTGGANGGALQGAPWPNDHNGAPAAHYLNSNGAHLAPTYPVAAPQAPPYQRYQAAVPQAQGYPPPQQGPYQPPQNYQYGPSGAPYGYNQPPPQAYGAPAPAPQYGNQGYQPPQYGQYPQQNGPPHPGYPGGYQNAPQPYPPPQAAPPYQQPPPSYPPRGGPYAPPQWNNTQSAPYNAPPFQQPNNPYTTQYNPDFDRNSSGRRKQFQSQQSPRKQYGSNGLQTSPQTPSSISNHTQYPSTAAQHSSLAGTPRAPSASAAQASPISVSSASNKAQTGEMVRRSSNVTNHSLAQKDERSRPSEEGEVAEVDPLEAEFKWEMEKIFKESLPTENVILAQPLSTKFDMTPVPLIHIGPAPSVSRYARKDNVKEFIRPIRSQPQWSYLQEDPAFSDTKTDDELIPLEEVTYWMAKRQGVDPYILSSRIGEQNSDDRHDDAASTTNMESSTESVAGDTQDKHQCVEDVDHGMPDTSTGQEPGTPPAIRPGTPTLDRTGTPSLDTVDDVWAPQPGEGALATSEIQDPTEALLASLGVTGSPKPVRKRSAPRLSISTNETSSCKRPRTMTPQSISNYEPQPLLPLHGQDVHALPNNRPSPNGGLGQAKPPHNRSMQNNVPYDNRQYTAPQHNANGNAMSPTNGSPFSNGPYSSISPHSQFPNGPQYRNAPGGMQTPGAYGNSHHGIPQQNHGTPEFHDPWAVPHQSNPHEQQLHGMAQNGSSTHAALPQGLYGNDMPQLASGSNGSPKENMPPHGKPSYQPFNTTRGGQSSRRNSGHTTRRSSRGKRSSSIPHQYPEAFQGQFDGGDDTPTSSVKTPVFSEGQNSKTSDNNDPEESPLTPTSAEILGKLTQPTRKDSNDKKADDATRRPRRPQPVVEEAYSRRW